MDKPSIAVVVPSLNGEVTTLRQALAGQTWAPDEFEVVVNVKPNGKARNQGVAATQSEYIVFIDDDAIPGSPDLIENLVCLLRSDPTIGVAGAARVLPPDAPPFQRRVAREIPRTVNPVPDAPLETNPPLDRYGHSLITTTCCAIRREVFEQAGRFSEILPSGVDTDFFYRVRRLGYRFVMAPHIYVEHPAPGNLRSLMKKFQWYGLGYGFETQRRPEQRMGLRLPTPFHRLAFITLATLWVIPNIFILYSFGYPQLRFGFRPLKALSTYAVAKGYIKAWSKAGK